VQYDTFNDPAPGSPQAEYQHPGQARGWKGQFAKEQLSPHDGEFYTKGRAEVRGGPGPETSKYWLTTPHGIHGPHFNVHDAFDAAEPFLAQDAEIGRGQGELFAPPRARGAARQRRPLARRKTGWTGWGPAVFPKTRKVAGWDWDNHLNGYLANKPQHFACECGDSFPTPSGFQRCACGRQYNSYVIGTGGSNREASAEKFIVREIPVRPDVIVANRKLALRKGAPFAGYEDFEDCESKNSDKGRPDAYCGEIKHRVEDEKKAYRRLVDPRTGTIHNLIDPGEIDEGEDPKHPTFRKQPKDWARRNGDGKWTPSAIG
jgi:predicted small secreted protein